jgi:beta-mannosidase
LFLELTLTDAQGARLSRRAYWLRILQMLADLEARKRWQAAPVAEPLTQSGPWLKPQIAALATSLQSSIKIESQSAKETVVSLTIENSGQLPAYPVRIDLLPDVYSALWTDNYFWLASGEKATIRGTIRLDMTGLDPLTNPPAASLKDLRVRVSSWNSPATELHLR